MIPDAVPRRRWRGLVRSATERPVPPRRLLSFAVVGVALAIGAALSPVAQAEYIHSFRPIDATAGSDAVAPLALARAKPDALLLTLPCEERNTTSTFRTEHLGNWWSLDGAVRSPFVYPDLGPGLQVDVGHGLATVFLGGRELLSLPVVHQDGCAVSLDYRDGSWELDDGDRRVSVAADGPRVIEAGFFGPAASSPVSGVTVTTRELGSSPGLLNLLLVLAAVLVAAFVGRELMSRTERAEGPVRVRILARVRSAVNAVDLVVAAVLVLWWVVIPAGFDDGWIVAIQGGYDRYGDFSGIYENTTAAPIGYWLHWIQRFWLSLSADPIVMRLPALLIGLFTWAGLRSVLVHAVGRSVRTAAWLMGAVYLVGFGAWGMTLRPEPVLAALTVVSLWCALRFSVDHSSRVLVLWIVVVAFGVTSHPAGVLVAAPLVASIPVLWRWARSAAGGFNAGAALGLFALVALVLLFIDGNLATRLESLKASRLGGHDLSVFDELQRYRFLNEAPYGALLRRASVVFTLLGAAAVVVGSVVRASTARRLIGWSLVAGIGLLALTPSKWTWHLGGLAGLTAVVVAVELAALRDSGRGPTRSRWRELHGASLVLGLVFALAWVWTSVLPWTAFDVRTQQWWKGATNLSPLDLSSAVSWLLIAVTVWLLTSAVRRRRSAASSPAHWFVLVAAGLVIAVTAATLVVDTIRTDGWTFGRQNFEALIGREGCGLADEIQVPVPGSLRALSPTDDASQAADGRAAAVGFEGGGLLPPDAVTRAGVNAAYPLADMVAVGSWVAPAAGLVPDVNVGSYRSPWHAIGSEDDQVVVMVLGLLNGGETSGNAVALQWGRSTGSEVEALGIETIDVTGYYLDWRMVASTPPPGTDRVRVLARDDTDDNAASWVAVSQPLGVALDSIGAIVRESDPSILVSSPLALYFPCVEVPPFEAGVVDPPGMFVNMWRTPWQTAFAAAAATDRYFLIDVTLSPPAPRTQVGAHLGDPDHFVFVSQEYLTGTAARANGRFTLVDFG